MPESARFATVRAGNVRSDPPTRRNRPRPGPRRPSVYLIGYLLFLAGGLIALWQLDVLDDLGPVWTGVIVLVSLGLGVMIAVANSGRKENIEIKSK